MLKLNVCHYCALVEKRRIDLKNKISTQAHTKNNDLRNFSR